ncbi:MAG: NAD-dependent epimerase/dehydratase family protein [Thermoplasmataceae archaeon]
MATIEGKRILFTGGCGFIGSNFVRKIHHNNEITIMDNLSGGKEEFLSDLISKGKVKLLKRDIRDPSSFSNMGEFDTVIHLAADSDVRQGAIDHKFSLDTNVIGTFNLLEFMKEKGVKEMIFSSTSAVTGDTDVLPTPETFGPCLPISSYGASKLASEAFISSYSHYHGIKASIFRFANVVGRNSTHGVIFDFINKLKKNSKYLEILGDGSQSKSYIHVDDCVDAMIHVFNRTAKTDIVNLGNSEVTSVKKIAETVIEQMGLKGIPMKFTGGPEGRGWKGDIKHAFLSIEKMTSLGWKNRYSSDEAVNQAVAESLKQILK